MNKKIVVTGAEGFIGSYIVSSALTQGYRVVGIDNLSKYGQKTHSFHSNKNYRQEIFDVTDTRRLEELFADADHVIAGAAMIGGISYFHSYAYDLLASNERIIASTCDAAIKAHKKGILKKLTYLSSSMVFESTTTWPSKEGDQLNYPPPISSYGFQKLSVEYFARAAWLQYKLPFTILRPFNCVGIGEYRALGDIEISSGNVKLAMSHVVPDLIQKVIKGQNPLVILGDGNQIRCYTYGKDLARGILSSLDNQHATNEDFNLSSSEATTVLQLAEKIWNKVHGPGKPFRYVTSKGFDYDVSRRVPDVSKAEKILGFKATTTLDEMLDIVIPWIREMCNRGEI